MKILLPKDLVEVDFTYGPLFFLAGPIRGGDDWQMRAIHEIRKQIKHFTVANPCRYDDDPGHPLRHEAEKGTPHFARTTQWERYYIEKAATGRGCLLFWLPCESKEKPRKEGPYARDTYGELGAIRTHLRYNPLWKVVFGAEEKFPGLSVFKCNLEEDVGHEVPIYPTLQQTIAAAVDLAVEGK